MANVRILGLAFILVAMLSMAAYAQEEAGISDELGRQSFYLDYAAFDDSLSGDVIVEAYYKIFSSSLSYQKWGEKFRALYSVDITISKKGKQITGASSDGNLVADDYKATIAKDDFVINKLIFKVPPDNYDLGARLSDPGSGDIMKIKRELKLKDFGKNLPSLSSLEFVRDVTSGDSLQDFERSGVRLIPSVSRSFGEDAPEVILYYEIYNKPDFNGDYQVIYDIMKRDRPVFSDTSLFPSTGRLTGRLERLKVDTFQPGLYTMSMTVLSPGHKLELAREAEFVIGWSVLAVVKTDWETAVEQLRYIASGDEMKKLSKSPAEDRMRLWEEFWKSKDPTPSTLENELEDEYYRRVRYSQLNFGNFGNDDGWKSDRGMVYITYGPPDEIERHPFDIDSKPYQIWYYYNQKRIFRFVDFNGDGNYELIYPYDGDIRRFR